MQNTGFSCFAGGKMKKRKTGGRPAHIPCAVFFLTLFVSCATTWRGEPPEEPSPADEGGIRNEKPLTLTFTGDIMAHTVNYQTPDYTEIYADVTQFLRSDDITFSNLEIPVADSLPLSTYPRFNVHTPYLEAAVDAGCDVFSLANNHSNDQGAQGVRETLSTVERMRREGKIDAFSGLKERYDDEPRPVVIEKNGWKLLFFAVTQILNAYDEAGKLVYYVPPTEQGRAGFEESLKKMREENPCDLFVLSVHTNEPEYKTKAPETKKEWLRKLVRECGVDIVWAHHPHVMQEWETVPGGESGGGVPRQKLIIHSAGNFISGQRWNVNLEDPGAYREYTGDSYIFRVSVTRETLTAIPVLVTNYRNPSAEPGSGEWYLTIKHFNAEFIKSIEEEKLREYYEKRFELMMRFLE